jgi:hypothetical protein
MGFSSRHAGIQGILHLFEEVVKHPEFCGWASVIVRGELGTQLVSRLIGLGIVQVIISDARLGWSGPRHRPRHIGHATRSRRQMLPIRDLRAKAGTDKADATDMREAQQQLGHKSVKTTEIYPRARAGEKVTPTKQSTELRNAGAFAERNANARIAGTRM